MTTYSSSSLKTKRRKASGGKLGKAGLALLSRDFSLHCRRLRMAMGLNQQDFARLLGYRNREGKIAVSRLESGMHRPQRVYLAKFLELQRKYDEESNG